MQINLITFQPDLIDFGYRIDAERVPGVLRCPSRNHHVDLHQLEREDHALAGLVSADWSHWGYPLQSVPRRWMDSCQQEFVVKHFFKNEVCQLLKTFSWKEAKWMSWSVISSTLTSFSEPKAECTVNISFRMSERTPSVNFDEPITFIQ